MKPMWMYVCNKCGRTWFRCLAKMYNIYYCPKCGSKDYREELK